MIDIIAESFDIRPAHLNMLRAAIGFENFEDFKPDTKIFINVENNIVNAKWVGVDTKTISLNIDKLDQETTIKLAIYKIAKEVNNIHLPWGILTGIRPVRYLEEIIKKYGEESKNLFINYFMVDEQKYKIAKEILELQKPILNLRRSSYIIYIHIPFCPTRCKYCSFSVMSFENKLRYTVSEYVNYLLKEIEDYDGYLEHKNPISVYIGGGTPSILSPNDIDRIFRAIKNKFGDISEITFEAGRPDTINHELLNCLKNNDATRISVNPQTLTQKTLDNIRRKHEVEDFYRAFELCKKYDLDINTDIIIGLEGENLKDVKNTVDELTRLSPDYITVHSLAIKNGSYYRIKNMYIDYIENIDECFKYAHDRIINSNYMPYYLYRQKRQVGDNENIGYTKSDKLNIFNILSMDDKCDVLAFGMGAVSKFTSESGIVDRVFGFRDIDYYISHYKELNSLKKEAVNKINNI